MRLMCYTLELIEKLLAKIEKFIGWKKLANSSSLSPRPMKFAEAFICNF